MLKRRPVEMQIEQAGISVSAAADSSSVRASKSRPSDTTGFLGVRHAAISSCRPSHLLLLTGATASSSLDLAVLNRALHDGSIQSYRSPSTECRVCTKSLHQS